jgi:hypothetical protein
MSQGIYHLSDGGRGEERRDGGACMFSIDLPFPLHGKMLILHTHSNYLLGIQVPQCDLPMQMRANYKISRNIACSSTVYVKGIIFLSYCSLQRDPTKKRLGWCPHSSDDAPPPAVVDRTLLYYISLFLPLCG